MSGQDWSEECASPLGTNCTVTDTSENSHSSGPPLRYTPLSPLSRHASLLCLPLYTGPGAIVLANPSMTSGPTMVITEEPEPQRANSHSLEESRKHELEVTRSWQRVGRQQQWLQGKGRSQPGQRTRDDVEKLPAGGSGSDCRGFPLPRGGRRTDAPSHVGPRDHPSDLLCPPPHDIFKSQCGLVPAGPHRALGDGLGAVRIFQTLEDKCTFSLHLLKASLLRVQDIPLGPDFGSLSTLQGTLVMMHLLYHWLVPPVG